MKRKNTGLAMLVLAAVFMTAACSPTGVNSKTGNSGSTAAEGASSGGTHYDLTLGTAASTGTYYVVGAAIANEVNTKNPNLTVVAQTTNGGVECKPLYVRRDGSWYDKCRCCLLVIAWRRQWFL